MGDCIKIKTLLVDIQENGIVRESVSGTYICRVKEDVETKTILESSFVAPPTCTPTERAFLDELREKGEFTELGNICIKGGSSIIWKGDFTKSNLRELANETIRA